MASPEDSGGRGENRCVLPTDQTDSTCFEEKGIRGLIHGNTGRPSHHRISEVLRQKILQLSRDDYREFNDTHFTLRSWGKRDGSLNREMVRRIRRDAGIGPKRKWTANTHLKHREPMAQER